MPHLGKGTRLRKVMGAGFSPVPAAIFNDLATWEQIPFLYTAQNRRLAAEMAQLAEEPEKLARLVAVLEDQLGHDLAFAVERGKIAANSDAATGIDLSVVERRLAVPLSAQDMRASLSGHRAALQQGVVDTLALAGLSAFQVDRVVYVGGSSLLSIVSDAVAAELPDAQPSYNEVFTAVADGLAIAAGQGGRVAS